MNSRQALLSAVLCAAALSAGCASQSPPPTGEIARARTLIQQAESSGAQRFAAVDLDSARSKVQSAEAASKENENELARRLAVEAALDAELAAAKTSSGQAREAVDQVNESLETLRRETQRGQAPAQ